MINSFRISSFSGDRSAIGHYQEGKRAKRAFVLSPGSLGKSLCVSRLGVLLAAA